MKRSHLRGFAGAFAAAMISIALPAAAQDLTIGLGANVTSIDPHFHNLSPNSNVATHFFDKLIDQDEQQKLMPGLATEWKALDNTTWEFKLRRGVKFHDDSDFTAEDVVATLKRVPWVPNSPSSFRIYSQAITAHEIVDPYTIRFKTANPYPLLPTDLSTIFIVSKKNEQAPTGDFNNGKAAIGTGPFKFVEYLPGDRIVGQRNDAYWGKKPDWAKVTLKLITNNSARVAALLAGDVQVIEAVPATDYSRLKTNANIALSQIVGNRVIYLHVDSFRDQTPFATDKAGAVLPNNPLKDVRVRRALSKAINRPAISERIMEGLAIPAGGVLAEGFFGSSPKLKADAMDPDGAKKLLTEAGYPNGFGLTIHGPNDRYPNDEKVLQAVGPGRGGSNRGRYSNPKVDELTNQALATVDDAKRDKLLQEATEVAMADVGLIPLHYQINVWATRKGLTYKPRADEYTLAMSVSRSN